MLESAQTGIANKRENMPHGNSSVMEEKKNLYVTRKILHAPQVPFQEFWGKKIHFSLFTHLQVTSNIY